MSDFVKAMTSENSHWDTILQDFANSPLDGIRGRGGKRHQDDIQDDINLRWLFAFLNFIELSKNKFKN